MRGLRNLIFPKFKIWKWSRKIMFEYSGDQFRLVSDQRVRMAPPTSDPIANYQNQTGFWVTVSDAQGSILYRRILQTPTFLGKEVFSKKATEPLYRIDSNAPLHLVVVIPDLPLGTQLELHGSGREAAGKQTPAVRIAGISLVKTGEKGGVRGRK